MIQTVAYTNTETKMKTLISLYAFRIVENVHYSLFVYRNDASQLQMEPMTTDSIISKNDNCKLLCNRQTKQHIRKSLLHYL